MAWLGVQYQLEGLNLAGDRTLDDAWNLFFASETNAHARRWMSGGGGGAFVHTGRQNQQQIKVLWLLLYDFAWYTWGAFVEITNW